MTDTIQVQSGYSDVNGLRMYYEIRGEGEPVVLIHGGGSTMNTSFGKILPLLEKSFRVIAVELQGHGRTGDRDAPFSFEQDADDVATLLSNLHVSKASFLGFSNGGNTAIKIAARYPEIMTRLILASTFYKREGLVPGFFDGMENATLENMPRVLKDGFLQVNPDDAKLLNMFNKDRERMMYFSDWKDETLQSIAVPTLILCGDRDVVTVGHSAAMAKLIPHSRMLVISCDHGGYFGVAESTDPDQEMISFTVYLMTKFLKGQF